MLDNVPRFVRSYRRIDIIDSETETTLADPFEKARGKRATPYWLKKIDEKLLAKHKRLIELQEQGRRDTTPRKKAK